MTVLASVRVLDLTLGPVRLGPRVLADLGARVACATPPGETWDATAAWYGIGKVRAVAQPGCGVCHGLVRDLALASDVVAVQPEHPLAAALGGADTLGAGAPHTILATVTPFGRTGPRAGWTGSELIAQASGGFLARPEETGVAPAMVGAPAIAAGAGLQLAAAVMLALRGRRTTGRATAIDLSLQEAAVNMMYLYPMIEWLKTGGEAAQGGNKRRIWRCKDGYVNWLWWTGPGWGRLNVPLVHWMRDHGLGESLVDEPWEQLKVSELDPARIAAWEAQFEEFFLRFEMRTLYNESVRRRIMLYPTNSPADVLADEQLAARNVFFRFAAEGNAPVTAPGTWGWRDGQPLGPAHQPDAGQPPDDEHARLLDALAGHVLAAHGGAK